MSTRKTVDRWDIMISKSGYGWKTVCSEYTMSEATDKYLELLKKADGKYQVIVRKRREKIGTPIMVIRGV